MSQQQQDYYSGVWSILKSRNNVVFTNERFNSNEILFRVRSMVKEWKFLNELTPDEERPESEHKRKKTYFVRWESTRMGYVKIIFDGSFKVVTGYIIRDYKGKLMKAGATNIGKAGAGSGFK